MHEMSCALTNVSHVDSWAQSPQLYSLHNLSAAQQFQHKAGQGSMATTLQADGRLRIFEYLRSISIPRALQQVLLVAMMVGGEDLHAAIGRRKGAHVPHPQSVILRHTQKPSVNRASISL